MQACLHPGEIFTPGSLSAAFGSIKRVLVLPYCVVTEQYLFPRRVIVIG